MCGSSRVRWTLGASSAGDGPRIARDRHPATRRTPRRGLALHSRSPSTLSAPVIADRRCGRYPPTGERNKVRLGAVPVAYHQPKMPIAEPPNRPLGPPTPAPAGWSTRELDTLTAVADTFVAGTAPRRARLAAEALNLAADPEQVLQLRLVLRAFDSRLANVLLTGRAVRFRRLDLAGRERYLLGWSTSRIPQRRAAYQGLKRLLAFLAYADPGEDGDNPRLRRDRLRAPARARDRRPIADRAARRPVSRGHDTRRRPDRHRGRRGGRRLWRRRWRRRGRPRLGRPVGGRARGGAVRAGARAPRRRAGRLRPAVPQPRPQRLVGRVDHDVRRRGRRGRHARQLDDAASPRPRPSERAGRRITASPGSTTAWSTRTSRRSSASSGSASRPTCRRRTSWSSAALRPWARNRARPDATASTAGTAADAGSAAVGAPSSRGSGCTSPRRGGTARGSSRTRRWSGSWSRTGAPRVSRPPRSVDGVRRRIVVRAPTVVVAAGTLRTPVVLLRSGIDHPAMGRNLRLHPVSIIGAFLDEDVTMWRGTTQAARSLEHARRRGRRRRGRVRRRVRAGDAGADRAHVPVGRQGRVPVADAGHPACGAAARDHRRPRWWPGPDLARRPAAHRLHGGARGSRRTAAGARDRGPDRLGGRLAADGRAGDTGGVVRRGRGTGRSGGLRRVRGAASRRRLPAQPGHGRVGAPDGVGAGGLGAARLRVRPVGPGPAADARPGRDRVIDGLYVGDASLFPTALGVNPMITTMVWARRVARTVLSEATRG